MESPSDQPQPHTPEVTVVLRPAGRGNWSTLTMVLTGDRAQPLLFRVGHLINGVHHLADVGFGLFED